MLKYLVPQFPLKDLPVMLAFSALGAVIAGCYGIAHDQITYWIGPEYFTRMKFHQFRWANPQLGDRVFVSCIGFLATWWVGLIAAWILSRRILPNQPRSIAYKNILVGFAVVLITTFAFGLLGFAYGINLGPDCDYSTWNSLLDPLGVADKWSFVRVAYIHNAGYLGGLAGLVFACLVLKPVIRKNSE